MTIEELLGHTTEQLEAMSDAELEAHMEGYFKYTRPDRVDLLAPSKSKKEITSSVIAKIASPKVSSKPKKQSFKDELLAMLQASGAATK